MATDLGFCPRHRIAFNRRFEPVCPQCLLARTDPPNALDFDAATQRPLDSTGKPLDAFTLKPVV